MKPPLKTYLVPAAALLLLAVTLTAAWMQQPFLFLGLQGTWQRQADEQTGTKLELAVRGKSMEYRFVSERFSELDDTLHAYRWEALDADTVRVYYDEGHWVDTTVSVDGKTLTLSPAVTVREECEVWYKK